MSVASGGAITDIDYKWNGSRGPEPVTLPGVAREITRQYLIALEALHQGLGKSLHDFQPKNIYYDKAAQKISVIDLNLLAPTVLHNGQEVTFNPVTNVEQAGKVYYKLLTGQNLLGKNLDTTRPDIAEDLAKIPGAAALQPIFEKALNSDPTKRYKFAAEFRKDLEQLAE